MKEVRITTLIFFWGFILSSEIIKNNYLQAISLFVGIFYGCIYIYLIVKK